MKQIAAVWLAFFSFISISPAQQPVRNFSSEPAQFTVQVGDMFMAINKKDGEAFALEFTEAFNSFQPEVQKEIIELSNLMVKKRFQPAPEFYSYFNSLIVFSKGTIDENSFNAWRSSLQKMSSGPAKKFSDYLEMSHDLVTENVLYRTSTIRWSTDQPNFTFEYDSVPAVRFTNVSLTGYAKGDSSVIQNTSGIYFPVDGKWIGKGGKLDWRRTGLSADEVWAELDEYVISLRSPQYEADSVVFHNQNYFQKPLMGRIEEKILANANESNASYPQFQSYQQSFIIPNIIPGVDYKGGFSQAGAQFIGSGTDAEPANLLFYRNKKVQLKASSKTFVIREERIVTERGAVTIYIGEEDSIYHPGLEIKLISKDRVLSLFRDKKGVSRSPYYNTYHKLDMDFESLIWKIDEPMISMEVLRGSTESSARFESSNYYSSALYRRMLASANQHPLLVLYDVAKKFDSRTFTGEDVAIHWRLPLEQVEPLLITLSNMGFIHYSSETKMVQLKEKLYDYILANGKKKDYDVIEILSDISGASNATLSLLNFDLTIRGINSILLSDSQRVVVSPRNGEVVMSKNRDFKFGGQVSSGLLEFRGQEFAFNYDDFKIDLVNVDSMIIIIPAGEKDEQGRLPVRRLKTVVTQVQGSIAIDSPGNKSGLKDLGQYPLLNSTKDSYVYYDGKSVQGGAYDRNRFYFKVNPFSMDSLDNFDSQLFKLDGTFSSGGVFPDFQEELRVQEDFSLGFARKTPEGGFPAYGGKSTFVNEIRLSHEGLRGNGDFKYLHSVSSSDDFIFFPDSMNGIAQNHTQTEVTGSKEFPEVQGTDVRVHYVPTSDFLEVTAREKPIQMFASQAEAHNSVFLQPAGLTGTGRMVFKGAEMDAELYSYKAKEIFSDTANFRLAAFETAEFAFKTSNVNAHIDFTKREGRFKSNGGGSFVEFPMNQYLCFMDQFTWNMDKDDIEMSAGNNAVAAVDPTNSGLDLSGSKFVSTHPDQDSLTFYAPSAKYDLKNHIITARGVKFFQVADAMLYPHDGLVVIEKKAAMQTLENARLLANFVTQFHNIYEANINVFGRKSYSANGKYDYINELKEVQTITFSTVATDTTGQTFGKGSISDTTFMLSPRFSFQGDFSMVASNQFLIFDGLTKIEHDCSILARNWMRFKSEINPEEIYIPVDTVPVDGSNNPIGNGLIVSMDSVHLYSTFLSAKKQSKDVEVISANGFLFFDKPSQEYRISSKEKLNEFSLPGNYVSLNSNACKMYAEGKMTLGSDLGQVKLNPVGTVVQNLNDQSVVFDLVLPIDFFFDNSALEKMADHFVKSGTGEGVDNARPVYEKALREIMGKTEADKLIAQIGLYGSFKKLPDELESTIFLSDVKMKWDEISSSYRSVGKIGIGSIGKVQVNKLVSGYVEVQKKRSGDVLNIYFEMDGGVWYYFNYTRSSMQAISSNTEFNTILMELKPDSRRMDVPKGEAPYAFMLSTESKKKQFVRKMEEGIEEPGN